MNENVLLHFLDDAVAVRLSEIVAIEAVDGPVAPCRRCGSINRDDERKTAVRLRDSKVVYLRTTFDEVMKTVQIATMSEAIQ